MVALCGYSRGGRWEFGDTGNDCLHWVRLMDLLLLMVDLVRVLLLLECRRWGSVRCKAGIRACGLGLLSRTQRRATWYQDLMIVLPDHLLPFDLVLLLALGQNPFVLLFILFFSFVLFFSIGGIISLCSQILDKYLLRLLLKVSVVLRLRLLLVCQSAPRGHRRTAWAQSRWVAFGAFMIHGVSKILGLSLITWLLKNLLLLILWSSFKRGPASAYRSTAILIFESALRVLSGGLVVVGVAHRCCHLSIAWLIVIHLSFWIIGTWYCHEGALKTLA